MSENEGYYRNIRVAFFRVKNHSILDIYNDNMRGIFKKYFFFEIGGVVIEFNLWFE